MSEHFPTSDIPSPNTLPPGTYEAPITPYTEIQPVISDPQEENVANPIDANDTSPQSNQGAPVKPAFKRLNKAYGPVSAKARRHSERREAIIAEYADSGSLTGSTKRYDLSKVSQSQGSARKARVTAALNKKRITKQAASAEKAGNTIADLREAVNLSPDGQAELRSAIDEQVASSRALYPGNPDIQQQVSRAGEGLYWLHTGKPGDRLPECFIPLREADGLIKIVLDPRIPHAVVSSLVPVSNMAGLRQEQEGRRPTGSAIVGKAKVITDTARAILQATPGFALLHSFQQPVQSQSERPLTGTEKGVREASILENLYRQTGYTFPEYAYPETWEQALVKKDYHRRVARLDEETITANRAKPPEDPEIRVRNFMQSTLIARYAAEGSPQGPVQHDARLFGGIELVVDGPAQCAEVSLSSTLRRYVAEMQGTNLYGPDIAGLEVRIKHLFNRHMSLSAFSPVETHVMLQTLVSPQLSRYATTDPANTIAWLRQPYIPAESIVDTLPSNDDNDGYDGGHSSELVRADDFNRLHNSAVGNVLKDSRTADQRRGITLITASPLDRSLIGAATGAETVMSIALAPEAFGVNDVGQLGVQPYIPGYRLTSINLLDGGQVYDFARGGEADPYRRCTLPLNEEHMASIFQYCTNYSLEALGEAIAMQPPQTVADLVDIIKAQSNYYIPGAANAIKIDPGQYQYQTKDGRIYGQCTTFGTLASELVGLCGYAARTIDGKAISSSAESIKALGHQQVIVSDGGEPFIIDATPAGEYGEPGPQTRLRQIAGSIGQLVRGALGRNVDGATTDHDTAEQSQSSNEPNAEPKTEQIPIIPPEPTPQELAEASSNKAFAALASTRPAFRQQLAARMALDPHTLHNPDAFGAYMQKHHSRDADPFGRVFNHTVLATPIVDSFDPDRQFSNGWIDEELGRIANDAEYISNLVKDKSIARSLTGSALDPEVAKSLQRTLASLSANYNAILASRQILGS